jgi:hypothetical protein
MIEAVNLAIVSDLYTRFEDIKNGALAFGTANQDPESEFNYETDLHDFLEYVKDSIKNFFYLDQGGKSIKDMADFIGTNPNKEVSVVNFEYALTQYSEYLKGMNTYIGKAKENGTLSEEAKAQLDEVIGKDEKFIRSLFDIDVCSENSPEKITAREAFGLPALLLEIKNTYIPSWEEVNLTQTDIDKLIFLSIIRVAYYSTTGIMKSIDSVTSQLNQNETSPEVEEDRSYGVF